MNNNNASFRHHYRRKCRMEVFLEYVKKTDEKQNREVPVTENNFEKSEPSTEITVKLPGQNLG